jgi:hypothetical protein
MAELPRPKAGSRQCAGIFVRTTSMPTIYILLMGAVAFLARPARKVNKDPRALPVRALASR